MKDGFYNHVGAENVGMDAEFFHTNNVLYVLAEGNNQRSMELHVQENGDNLEFQLRGFIDNGQGYHDESYFQELHIKGAPNSVDAFHILEGAMTLMKLEQGV